MQITLVLAGSCFASCNPIESDQRGQTYKSCQTNNGGIGYPDRCVIPFNSWRDYYYNQGCDSYSSQGGLGSRQGGGALRSASKPMP